MQIRSQAQNKASRIDILRTLSYNILMAREIKALVTDLRTDQSEFRIYNNTRTSFETTVNVTSEVAKFLWNFGIVFTPIPILFGGALTLLCAGIETLNLPRYALMRRNPSNWIPPLD
jgi:hypothetical protein